MESNKVTIRDLVTEDNVVTLLYQYEVDGIGLVSNVELTYMRGKTEEAIMKPNIQQSLGKMMTKLLAGLIVRINGKDATTSQKEELVKSMRICDRDLLMQAHYICSFAPNTDFVATCSCGAEVKKNKSIYDMTVEKPSENSPSELRCTLYHGVELGEVKSKEVVVIPTNGIIQEQALMSNQSPAQIKDAILLRAIKEIVGIETYPSRLITEEMSTKDKNAILNKMEEFEGKVFNYFADSCPDCGKEIQLSIPTGNYFAGE